MKSATQIWPVSFLLSNVSPVWVVSWNVGASPMSGRGVGLMQDASSRRAKTVGQVCNLRRISRLSDREREPTHEWLLGAWSEDRSSAFQNSTGGLKIRRRLQTCPTNGDFTRRSSLISGRRTCRLTAGGRGQWLPSLRG